MKGFIILTHTCNLKCNYCYYNTNLLSKKNGYLSDDNLIKAIELFKNIGCNKVALTGGEPLLVKKLPLLIKDINKQNMKITIVTNGILLLEKKILKQVIMSEIDCIAISIHSAYRINNFLNKLKGIIKEFKNSNIRIKLNFTICKNNIKYLKKIINFAVDNNIYLMIQPVSLPVLNKYDSLSLKNLDKNINGTLFKNIDYWSNKFNEEDYAGFFKNYLNNNLKITPDCNAGKNFVVIDVDGKISPCFYNNHTFGLLGVNDPDEIKNKINNFKPKKNTCFGNHCLVLSYFGKYL